MKAAFLRPWFCLAFILGLIGLVGPGILTAGAQVSEGIGWVWANEPATASYTPFATYQYNSTGAQNTISRYEAGLYRVEFIGLASTTTVAAAHVSSYSTVVRCELDSMTPNGADYHVFVRCFAQDGSQADGRFTALLYMDSQVDAATGNAYVYSDAPEPVPGYQPARQYHSRGGRVLIDHLGPGLYRATIEGITHNNGTTLVSAYLNATPSNVYCAPRSWYPEGANMSVYVQCRAADGTPANSRFVLSFRTDLRLGWTAGATTFEHAYLWASQASNPGPYPPDSGYAYNGGGGAMSIQRPSTGVYDVLIPSVPAANKTAALATVYGVEPGRCTVVSWQDSGDGGTVVHVRCFDPAGAPKDLRFVLQYLTNSPEDPTWDGCGTVGEIPYSECLALVDLFGAAGGIGWTNRTGWLQTNTPCSWIGITCENSHVARVSLRQNNLIGVLHSGVDRLSRLQVFDVWNNQLTGTVPPSWSGLTSLRELQLGQNAFSGDLPPTLGALTRLTALNLATNAFTGTIPSSFGSLVNLLALDLRTNQLQGVVPLGVAQLCAAMGANCHLDLNAASLCIPGASSYRAIGVDPIGGLPLSGPCGNNAPTAVGDAYSTAHNSAINLPVLANDTDADGDALMVTAIADAPRHGTATIQPGATTVQYTPTTGYSGADLFQYTISDGRGGTSTATVSIIVGTPTTMAGQVTFRVDMNREIRLNNLRPGRTVGLMGGSAPLSWSVPTVMGDVNADGIFEVTVPFDLESGTSVQYKYVISADGTLTWEGSVGPGDSGNRVLPYAGTATIATVFFNNVSGVAAESAGEIPTEFALSSVYPNPFNPTARVAFDMVADAPVRIEVADAQGRLVRLLLDGMQTAGRHEVTLDAGDLPSGIYLVTMQTGSERFSRKVALVR